MNCVNSRRQILGSDEDYSVVIWVQALVRREGHYVVFLHGQHLHKIERRQGFVPGMWNTWPDAVSVLVPLSVIFLYRRYSCNCADMSRHR